MFAHRGTYSPPAAGSPFSFSFSWSLWDDDGTSQLSGQAGSGTASITAENLFEVRFPHPVATTTELVYLGISSPADDFAILLDFTPSLPRAAALCMTRPNFTSTVPLSRNYYEASQELGFFDTSSTPAVAFVDAGDVAFAPPGPPYNYDGRSMRAYNHPVAAPATVREYADTIATLLTASRIRATFVGTLDTLEFYVSDRGRTFGFINLSTLRDLPRLFVGSWD